MKTIVRKAYWNYEKEEKWLNEMSAKGFALTDYSWCRYVFSDCEPGEFIYRLELLENLPSHPESLKYIRFMEENDAEYVASYMRWVYFRKKVSARAFDIYSDIESKINHYQRIIRLFSVISFGNLVAGASNVYIGIPLLRQGFFTNIIAGGICCAIGAVMLTCLCIPLWKKIIRLKKEKVIVE